MIEEEFKVPPKSPKGVLSSAELTRRLGKIVGTSIRLTGKTRTDGAAIRKIVAQCLYSQGLSAPARVGTYHIIPPRGKGIPRLLRELIDTYVVTSGNSYNLQVWNRLPNSRMPLIEYSDGKTIKSNDIRLVFVKVDLRKNIIESVVVLTPQYIERHFGPFGIPTIKHQFIISEQKRQEIYKNGGMLIGSDSYPCRQRYVLPFEGINRFPKAKSDVFGIEVLKRRLVPGLIGKKFTQSDTKSRGQALERKVAELLGYKVERRLVGQFPDLPNQLLEVKIQDSPTIDLGKYTPESRLLVCRQPEITTQDIRYLIVLTHAKTNMVKGVVLLSGMDIESHFTYISASSYKCQRAIKMDFFNKYARKCVFNP
jgi:hypothetical protein